MTEQPALLKFDERAYSVEAVQKAAYRHMNALLVGISLCDGLIQCSIKPTSVTLGDAFDLALENFQKEVLDQQLRLKLKAETESVRNFILGIAFSRTGLQGGE